MNTARLFIRVDLCHPLSTLLFLFAVLLSGCSSPLAVQDTVDLCGLHILGGEY